MQTLFQKMRANRGRWVKPPIQAAEVQPAPEVPFMVVDGGRYVEVPQVDCWNGCSGCAFDSGGCAQGIVAGMAAFGGTCLQRRVIYLKAE